MNKFWNWIRDEDGGRILRLEGPIDSESFWGDETTPKAFRDELNAEQGDITVYINSPGGNFFAAAEIFTMVIEYPGKVTVKIDAIAASAASVVAMAGDVVLMSPVAMLMVHDPSTIAMGNARDMEKVISTLNEVKESIINAYAAKTGLSRNRIGKLMENETWMNAKKAVELGFADGILSDGNEEPEEEPDTGEKTPDAGDGGEETKEKGIRIRETRSMWEGKAGLYSSKIMGETILCRLGCPGGMAEEDTVPAGGEPSGEGVAGNGGSQGSGRTSVHPPKPVIGMDGKTEDGAMPYEILKDKLEWIR